MEQTSTNLIPQERIESKIFLIRNKRVMLDKDLSLLYDVPTKRLNEQVKRNIKRFPEQFMFQLTKAEKDGVVANCDHLKVLRFSPVLPYAFTEYGVVMLSSVLNSDKAIQINIQIINTFVKMRQILADNQEVKKKIEDLDEKYDKYLTEHGSLLIFHDKMIKGLLKDFREINKLLTPPKDDSEKEIGFRDRK